VVAGLHGRKTGKGFAIMRPTRPRPRSRPLRRPDVRL
jgi:hypothetical protein